MRPVRDDASTDGAGKATCSIFLNQRRGGRVRRRLRHVHGKEQHPILYCHGPYDARPYTRRVPQYFGV